MNNSKEKIAELVKKLQTDKKEGFEELYKLTSPTAFFIALEITRNEHDAQDVLQESYIKMLEEIDTLENPMSFTTWFHRIVINKSKDWIKKKNPSFFEKAKDEPNAPFHEEEELFDPESCLDRDSLREEVVEIIGELTDEKRICIIMMYFDEMSVNEIAEALEVPVSTVKNRLWVARKELKEKFKKRGITSVYSAMPIGVVIWALTQTAEAVSATFTASAASSEILAGIAVSASAAAATGAAASASGAGAASSAAATASSTATAAAAKTAALTVTQKVVAGVVATSIVGGSAVGVTTVVKNNRTESTTAAYVEEVTTAPSFETTLVIPAMATEIEISETETTAKEESTTQMPEPTATTSKPETTTRQTTLPPTEPSTAARATTTRATTTRATTTTTKAETTATTAATTTEAPTTTEPTTAAPASLTVSVINLDDSVEDTLSFTVPADTQMTWDYLVTLVQSEGYEPTAGIDGDALDAVAESGGSYSLNAYL